MQEGPGGNQEGIKAQQKQCPETFLWEKSPAPGTLLFRAFQAKPPYRPALNHVYHPMSYHLNTKTERASNLLLQTSGFK